MVLFPTTLSNEPTVFLLSIVAGNVEQKVFTTLTRIKGNGER